MDSQKIHITRFSGHVHEDPQKFLDELDSYLILHGIKVTSTDRKCAAFHLHLQGPALSWYQRLADTVKYNWNNLRAAFLAQYNNNRCFHIDVEKFHSLRLQPNQRIEDFYATVVDLGTRLDVADRDIMHRFIAGLPDQLAFFVRAGRPIDLAQAFESALSGAASGYRKSDPPELLQPTAASETCTTIPMAAAATQPSIDNLVRKIELLSTQVDDLRQLNSRNQDRHIPRGGFRQGGFRPRSQHQHTESVSGLTSSKCRGRGCVMCM